MRRADLEQTEEGLQRAVVAYLWLARPSAVWFHVPNGGRRRKIEAARMKGQGVRAGIPDLVFLWKGGGGGIELKTENGKQKPSQRIIELEFGEFSVPYEIARSLPEVQEILRRWRLVR